MAVQPPPNMYAASSSSAWSPPATSPAASLIAASPIASAASPTVTGVTLLATKPQHNCVECKRLKRGCDKGSPCGKCVKANKICEYRDPADDGIFGPIAAAKDINSLAFGTLLDILINKPRVREAVSLYFSGVNTWFTVIERASFERQLETAWDNLPAEASVMALSMALISRPPNQKTSSRGMGDVVYHGTKGILNLVQSTLPMSVQLLQAELLVAMYELSQSMPEQAYLSLGRCFQMTKAFKWHGPDFWSEQRQREIPGELKLCSILWWAIVYVDCLLNVEYPDETYPMHTTGLAPFSVVPLPEHFDQHFPVQFQFGGPYQGFRDANSDHIYGMAFPTATSTWHLSAVLQRLSDPTLPGMEPKDLTDSICQHAKSFSSAEGLTPGRNAALGIDLIALMKLNQAELLGGIVRDPNHVRAIRVMQHVIHIIAGKASKLAESEDLLTRGAFDPCWAFAMCYAAQLLVVHGGDGALRDDGWFMKVAELRTTLEKVSKRWNIAERYCGSVKIFLDNRLVQAGYVN